MHLLVLSAFRPESAVSASWRFSCLNAPFGAQCFPTTQHPLFKSRLIQSQCTFWCSVLSDGRTRVSV